MRRRLIMSYALILLMFAAAAYFFVMRTVYGMVRDNIFETSSNTMDRWADEMESVLEYGRGYLLTGAAGADLQYVLKTAGGDWAQGPDSSDPAADPGYAASNAAALTQIGNSRIIYPESAATKHLPAFLTLLAKSGDGTFRTVYSGDSSLYEKIYFPEDAWLGALEAKNGRFLLSPYTTDRAQYLRLSKIVYDNEHTDREIGAAALDFDYDHLAQYILTPLRVQGRIDAGIYDAAAGRFIGYRELKLTQETASLLGREGTWLVNGGRDIFYSRPLKGSDILLAGTRSLADARTVLMRSLRTLLLTAAGIFAIALCISFFMTHRISKPIIEERYLTRLRQDRIELQALQSQIHTHFLYNTLDTINWMALDHDAPDISHLVTNLSNLMRKSLNRGRSELSVRDEISHVQSYLAIQQVRFPDTFRADLDADEALMDDMVLKMLLQPLVENAILHVFNVNRLDRADNFLRISIGAEGEGEEERICLRVLNNAGGEDYDKVRALLEADSPAGIPDNVWSGYGIISIRDRLQIAYDDHARLSYSFEDGVLCALIAIDRSCTAPWREHTPNLPEGNTWDTAS